MTKVVLSFAALFLVLSATLPASAQQCFHCCSGVTIGGHCQSLCSGSCSGGHQQVMRKANQCPTQNQVLTCNGPYCKWVCSSTSSF
jgi:hypothetical protein